MVGEIMEVAADDEALGGVWSVFDTRGYVQIRNGFRGRVRESASKETNGLDDQQSWHSGCVG